MAGLNHGGSDKWEDTKYGGIEWYESETNEDKDIPHWFRLRRLFKITETDNRNEITEITGSTDSLNYEKKIGMN